VGHAGEELIHTFAFAMKFGITASQIRDTVVAFPTFSADIKHMLERSRGRAGPTKCVGNPTPCFVSRFPSGSGVPRGERACESHSQP